jgi:ribose-phosphate pyrophosphokinase
MNNNFTENSPFVLVSSPGMYGMGDRIQKILEEKGLKIHHHRVEYTRFSNGEILPRIPETVRRMNVFFLHPLQHPDPNTALVMMLLANDALTRASAAEINLVVPYLPYLRQDRKDKPRVPISAKVIADLIQSNRSVRRIITVDMHAEQIPGFFNIPVDNLPSYSLFVSYFKELLKNDTQKVVAVAPDFGGAVRTRRFAKRYGDIPVAIIEKRRNNPNESEIVSVIGEPVNDAIVIIFEDMIDTGGTIRKTEALLRKLGASEVFLSTAHGIFSGNAVKEFSSSEISVACTDSIPRERSFLKENPWMKIVSIDRMLADAIFECALVGGSMSRLNL